jgi:hypothetical protein
MKKNVLIKALMIISVCLMPLSGMAMDYQHKLEVTNMAFSWSLDTDKIHVQLTAETTGWVGIGFDPENAMQGANIIIGAVKGDKFKVEDHYGDRKRGHSKDETLGGTTDVLNPAGSEADGVTTISFSFPLQSQDKYDKPIATDRMIKIMLAYGAGKDSFKTRHPFRTVYEINLSTGESKKIK